MQLEQYALINPNSAVGDQLAFSSYQQQATLVPGGLETVH